MWNTIQKTIDGYTIKLSQNIIDNLDKGHFNYAITNKDGHIVNCSFSTGAPKERITIDMLDELFKSWHRWAF